jgi:DNA-binding NarL/FixJ family response regulator
MTGHPNARIGLRLDGGRHLTPHQLTVAKYIGIGLERNEIALAMGVSLRTVDMHRENAIRALQLRNNVDLAKWCIMAGYVTL